MRRIRNDSHSSFAKLSIKISSKKFDSDDSSDSVSENSPDFYFYSGNEDEELKVPSANLDGARRNKRI